MDMPPVNPGCITGTVAIAREMVYPFCALAPAESIPIGDGILFQDLTLKVKAMIICRSVSTILVAKTPRGKITLYTSVASCYCIQGVLL